MEEEEEEEKKQQQPEAGVERPSLPTLLQLSARVARKVC
jgi:hypothetical protein